MKKYPLLAVVACLALASAMCLQSTAGTGTRITIPRLEPDDTRQGYTLALLELALDKTVVEFGAYDLVHQDVVSGQSRRLRMLQEGDELDIVWSMTSRDREESLLPIRIPLQKGLLGYRIFIVKPKMAEAFSRVQSLEDLKELKAGQGHDWPDRKILERNGLPVVPSVSYQACFKMILGDRFDYFPRGVVEPWDEVEKFPDGTLAVEKTLMLRYPAPIYFFVNRNNPELARRIEKGLRAALADGTFDDLFYNNPYHRKAFEKARIKQRKVIDLVNPLLPPETPLEEKALWIDLDKLP